MFGVFFPSTGHFSLKCELRYKAISYWLVWLWQWMRLAVVRGSTIVEKRLFYQALAVLVSNCEVDDSV
jgi:hypothetical protein